MSYTDHTVQRRFKSNTPTVRTQAEHEKHCATRHSEGFSICTSPLLYHGFTVVTFTALWIVAEMWDIHIEYYYRSNGYNYSKYVVVKAAIACVHLY